MCFVETILALFRISEVVDIRDRFDVTKPISISGTQQNLNLDFEVVSLFVLYDRPVLFAIPASGWGISTLWRGVRLAK